MTHTDLWKRVKENLKKTYPQHAFSTWFEPIVSIGLNNDELILEVPNQFFFEWIQSHYKESIQLSVGEKYGKNIYIKYTVSPESGSPDEQPTAELGRSYLPKDPQRKNNINRQYTFASFIEGGVIPYLIPGTSIHGQTNILAQYTPCSPRKCAFGAIIFLIG